MKHDREEYKLLGITLFGVLAAAILFYFAMLRIGELSDTVSLIMTALHPLVLGIVFAFVLRPAQSRLERLLKSKKKPTIHKGKRKPTQWAKPISVFVTVAAAVGLITLFVLVVLPQVTETVKTLIKVVPGQVSRLLAQAQALVSGNEELEQRVTAVIVNAQGLLTGWIENDLLGSLMAVINNVIAVASMLLNIFLALIVTVYLLLGWERYVAQCKKLFLACSRNTVLNKAVFEAVAQMKIIFNGFVIGKLLDSLIIGVLCFIVMTILKMPYTMLISVIIGVTNIIPMFGPFIGAIPSAFLILLVSPSQCVAFIIFILILQQIDGNIIGPHILGDSTGLSALYVMVAMLLFSKLFGFVGMIIGVPAFATLYYLVKRLAESELRRRKLPTQTDDYMTQNDQTK